MKGKLLCIFVIAILLIPFTMVEGNNKPAENATVMIEWSDGKHSYSNGTFTNNEGYYEMNTASGKINISATNIISNGNETIMVENFSGFFNISGIAWANLTLSSFPKDNARIIGHVFNNETNETIEANISIMFYGAYFMGWNYTISNVNNGYEINLPPSNVTITASAKGFYPSSNQTVIAGTKNINFYLKPLPPPPPLTAVIKGYIKDSKTHEGIGNAIVGIFGKNYTNSTTANEYGYYEFNVPAGNGTIIVSASNFFSNFSNTSVGENETAWANITLQPLPQDNAWVCGHVLDNEGTPVAGANVSIQGHITVNYFQTASFYRYGTTDSNGYYNISVPAVNLWSPYPGLLVNVSSIDTIYAYADGYFDNSSILASPSNVIQPGQTLNANVTLDKMPEENCIVKGYIYLSTQQPSPPHIFYVGGAGSNNYTSIQEAINAANNGDIIKVYPGIYDGPIVINKEIKLMGDPVINGHGGYGIKIEANNTLVENFTVFNCSTGIYVHNNSFTLRNATIQNCTIHGSTYGIHAYGNYNVIADCKINVSLGGRGIEINGNENEIVGNEISSNRAYIGIDIYRCNNTIKNNVINGSFTYSMEVYGSSTYDNIITGNNIYVNGNGIIISYAYSNTFLNNTINASKDGIQFQHESSNNLIEKNEIKSNLYGIYIGVYEGKYDNNSFLDNNIQANSGIYLQYATNSTFINNNIESTNYAIYIENSTNNSFKNNTIGITRISFSYNGNISIANASMPAALPPHWQDIGKFLKIEKIDSQPAWMSIIVYYNDSDVVDLLENTLKIWKWNGSWYEDGWNGSRYLDMINNVVGVNITTFSIFAPLAMVPNHLPYATNPAPANESVDVSTNPTLSVIVHDEDGDTMNVSFYDASSDTLIGYVNGILPDNTASIVWNGLAYGTTYYWYVIVNDSYGKNKSDEWHFTTTIPKPSIIYVDDDYNESTSGWQYDHFANITDGINAVASSGTVKVYPGIYEESIVINKEISIMAQGNATNTIIKASGQNVVTMNYPCILDGFTIRDAHADYDNMRGIWVKADRCIIRNVTITNITAIQNDSITIYTYGIMVNSANNCTIENITIYDIEGNDSIVYGIYVYESNNNSFKNITIFNITSVSTAYGIYYLHCINNEISGANVNNIIAPSRYGIYLISSNNNTLEKIIASTSGYGVLVSDNNNILIEKCNISNEFYGIMIDNCNYSIIRENTVYENNYGITLWRYCYDNTIENNTIFNNQYHGIYFNSDDMFNTIKENIIYDGPYGIYLGSSAGNNMIFSNHIYNNDIDGLRSYSNHNNISFNYIHNNLEYGIFISQSENITIYANYIHDNGQNGIHISEYSSNNTIISNHIYNNSYDGIKLYYYSNYNLIGNNHIYNNTGNGIALYSSNNNVSFNYVYNNSKHGFFISSGNNNTAYSNYIYSNAWVGMEIADSSFNNKIFYNYIYNNSIDGVRLYDYADSNLIEGNYIYRNAENGVNIKKNCIDNRIISNKIHNNSFGILITNSHNNTISHCNISYNDIGGIKLYYADNNTIEWNIIVKNNGTNVYDTKNGIFLYSSNYNQIGNNEIGLNKYAGIHLYYNSGYNYIYNNTISSNEFYGIVLYGGDTSTWCNHNIISNNTIFNNGWSGIATGYEDGLGGINNITIKKNTIYGNIHYGIFIHTYSYNVTIEECIIHNNGEAGAFLQQSDNNQINRNTIYSNERGIVVINGSKNSMENNIIFNNTLWGIQIQGSQNNIIISNIIYNHTSEWNSAGIVAFTSSNHNNISSNIVYNNGIDNIELWNNSFYNEIWNNTVYGAEYGILLSRNSNNNSIIKNTIYGNIHGIGLGHANTTWGGAANNNSIYGNEIYSNVNGICITSSDNNTVEDNNISINIYAGVELINSSSNWIESNIINQNTNGIYIMYENEIHGFCHGIWNFNFETDCEDYMPGIGKMKGADFQWEQATSKIRYLTPKNGAEFAIVEGKVYDEVDYQDALSANYSSERINGSESNNQILNGTVLLCHTAEGNYIKMIIDSWGYDLYFTYEFLSPFNLSSKYNSIVTNHITNNFYGIFMANSSDNLIYNNYFNNAINAWNNGNNKWNISKTAGNNIIGGAWLGGNYWHDYNGSDTDGDDLGDTMLPYNCSGNITNGGDWHPLLLPVNHAPVVPYAPSPSNGATNVGRDVTLTWNCYDPDGDSLTYDVYFGISPSSLTKKVGNITATSYHIPNLQYSTTYYWHVVAWDEHGVKSQSQIWNFTTIENSPPSKPSLQAPSSGYTGNTITFSVKANDGNGDKIKYGIDWNNDGNVDEWTGYYNSGTTASISHVWNNDGTYFIKAIAEDEFGMKSEWSNVLQIVITEYVPPPINQPPSIEITSPQNNATVNGTITIHGNAGDDKSVLKVEIRIDGGAWSDATGTTSWSYSIDTTTLSNGKHVIKARSYDGSLYSNVVSININVFNNHIPSCIITEPENGSIVNGSIIIKGKASDIDGNDTITKVEIRIDNNGWHVANGTNSWNYSINTKELKNGKHVVESRSYDGHDYSNVASIHIEVKNKKKTPGFELIAFIAAITIIAGIMKKKEANVNECER